MENIHLYWTNVFAVFIALRGYYYLCGIIAKKKVQKMLTLEEKIVDTWEMHFVFRWLLPTCVALAWGCEIPNMINLYATFGFEQYFLLIFVFILPTFIILSVMSVRMYLTLDRIIIISSFNFLNKNPGLRNLGKSFYFKNMKNLELSKNARGIKVIIFKYKDRNMRFGALKNTELYYKSLLRIIKLVQY